MSDHSITLLIEKLEGAEVGSRELDGAVWYAIHEPDVEHGCLHIEQTEQGPMEVLTCELGSKFADCVEKYTTSLDAALALAERVLPGWWWTAGRCGLTCHASVGPDSKFIGEPDLSRFDSGFHADVPNPSTPAIALCIAILRAQSEAR